MSGLFENVSGLVIQGLALVGAVAVLVICFVAGVVVRTAGGPSTPKALTQELNRQFLVLSLLAAVTVSLVVSGVPVMVALSVTLVLLLASWRWFLEVVLVALGGTGLAIVLHLLIK